MCAPTATRSTPASRRSSTPAAASPASRPATPRQPRSSCSTAPVHAPPCAGPALLRCRPPWLSVVERSRDHVTPEEAPMFEAVEGLVGEHADLERRLSLPETHADARLAKR